MNLNGRRIIYVEIILLNPKGLQGRSGALEHANGSRFFSYPNFTCLLGTGLQLLPATLRIHFRTYALSFETNFFYSFKI